MKPREPRIKVLVKARMRLGGTWSDVAIRNISSRGLMLEASAAPSRGTYLEIHRGRHVIVSRVAWSKGRRFGVQTQQKLDVGAIIKEPDLSGANYNEVVKAQPSFERRSRPRPGDAQRRWKGEESRFLSKAIEFASVGAAAAFAAALVFDVASRTLSQPIAAVSAELSN